MRPHIEAYPCANAVQIFVDRRQSQIVALYPDFTPVFARLREGQGNGKRNCDTDQSRKQQGPFHGAFLHLLPRLPAVGF